MASGIANQIAAFMMERVQTYTKTDQNGFNTVFFSPHSDVQENFGLVNDGRVYALYTYTAEKDDELSFECGEELLVLTRGDETEKEWWWARNNREETGYIPRNLLGVGDNILCVLVSMEGR